MKKQINYTRGKYTWNFVQIAMQVILTVQEPVKNVLCHWKILVRLNLLLQKIILISTQRTQPQYDSFKDNTRQNASNTVYFSEVKKYLADKDDKVHVLMVNSFSKWLNQIFGVEEKYTIQIDSILNNMQYDGYEIIDVKFSTEQNQGLFGEMEGFYTMILYR